MLHIYRNIKKNKKLQTNIIPAGQDLEQTNITKERVYGHMITKKSNVCQINF